MTALRQRMTEDMQVRNLALNTQISYVQQVSCSLATSANPRLNWAERTSALTRSI